jgi:prepilin-type N-terminal cleavage/methylation domain-containing protein
VYDGRLLVMKIYHYKKGFTLIELLVSVAIFSVMMVMALGALLSLSVADRKAETVKSAIDNLTFALDSMSRAIRTGSLYDCGNQASTAPTNCISPGANYFTFLAASTAASPGGVQTYYRLENLTTDPSNAATECGQTAPNVGCIERSTLGGAAGTWLPITSPDIYINIASPGFLFHTTGAPAGDNIQPKVTITVSGTVPVSATQNTNFYMQTGVTQRIYDQ